MRARFAAIYALLAAALVAAAAGGYAAATAAPRPGESIAEVSVRDPFGKTSFWLADYGSAPALRVEVRHWSVCRASDAYC